MKLSIISFTAQGALLSVKIKETAEQCDISLYTKYSGVLCEKCQKAQILSVQQRISEWAGQQLARKNAILFIGACGIAVRAIAPHITDKLHDSPVLVMDEQGRFIIPILSGHMGGANELAVYFAEKMGGTPVITTATDINNKFAVDLFAKKNNLSIANKEGIAKVSSKVLTGENVTIAIEPGHVREGSRFPTYLHEVCYPPRQRVDIVITSENTNFDAAILLKPREYVIGMGCRKGKEAEKVEALIQQSLKGLGISEMQVLALASIDQKSEEEGLLAWSRKENIPFLTYSAKQLQEVKGDFHKSVFVKETVGVDNVCERAALKACEDAREAGRLVLEKHAWDGMTIAIAKKEWSVLFDET